MARTRQVAKLEAELDHLLASITDTVEADLVAAWATMLRQIAPDIDAAVLDLGARYGAGVRLSPHKLAASQRALRAMAAIKDALQELERYGAQQITPATRRVIDDTARQATRILDASTPPGLDLSLTRVDPDALTAIARRATERITALNYAVTVEQTAAIQRELLAGIPRGTNPLQVARKMTRGIEDLFIGGLPRARNIARTEMIDAHRSAMHRALMDNQDVVTGWRWLASLGHRTCPACWGMHGRVFPVGTLGPAGHPSCRCSSSPVTRSWADLGFDGPEPADVFPDADAAFGKLTAAQQETVLGPTRFAAYQDGRFPRDAWATLKPNQAWRPSYVPAPVPRAAA